MCTGVTFSLSLTVKIYVPFNLDSYIVLFDGLIFFYTCTTTLSLEVGLLVWRIVDTSHGHDLMDVTWQLLGDSDWSPATTAHKQVSSAMNTLASKIPVDFYVALGDNFYSSGVKNVDSKRFDQSFESVYSGVNLQKKWYVAPGNHDYGGNVSAQIAYSSKSTRWTFPKEYHSHSFTSSELPPPSDSGTGWNSSWSLHCPVRTRGRTLPCS